MKTLIYILIILSWTACNNSDDSGHVDKRLDTLDQISKTENIDTLIKQNTHLTKITVIVLPPFDQIANAGVSPNIQEYLETEISKDTNLTLIKFPYRQLTGVPYQNVYDKKYCKPILDKIKADIVIMSKIDQVERTGQMNEDKWNLRIRIYNSKTDNQTTSEVTADNLTGDAIKNVLQNKLQVLTNEIKNNH